MDNFIYVMFIHWVSDFILQERKIVETKSKNIIALLQHTSIYSLAMMFGMFLLNPDGVKVMNFMCITFLAHTITDYITSKVSSYYYQEDKIHSFWCTVGFDQWLHFLQLYLTYKFLYLT